MQDAHVGRVVTCHNKDLLEDEDAAHIIDSWLFVGNIAPQVHPP